MTDQQPPPDQDGLEDYFTDFEGQRMLAALRDLWRGGANDTGVARPDSIAPIPEGLALEEAERLARQREPGDGAAQISVAERIAQVLSS